VPEIRRDLVRYFGTASVRRLLAARLILGRDELDALGGGGAAAAAIVTDRNLRLEYDTPLRVFGSNVKLNDVDPMLLDAMSQTFLERVHAALGPGGDQVEGLLELWDGCFADQSRRGLAIVAAAWGDVAPDDARAAVRRAMSAGAVSGDVIRKIATAALSVSRSEAIRLAVVLRDQKRTDESIEVLRIIAAKSPGDAEAAYLLCQAYLLAGRADEARTAFASGVAADPCHSMRSGLAKAIELLR
jgi:tetratricopeptide (TPR) repeat protein